MHLKKIIQKKNNLEKIALKANSDKNILLIKIMKLNKQLGFYIENALLNKKIVNVLQKKYNFKNKFINLEKENTNKLIKSVKKIFYPKKELWIYLTEEQKYSTDSYSRYEKMMLNKIKKNLKNVDFITIGERAFEFAKINKINVVKNFPNNDKNNNISLELSQIIKILYIEQNYTQVNFVINTNKIFNDSFTILPMENMDVEKLSNSHEYSQLENIENFKILPDIDNFISNEIDIYLENVVQALIIESSFYSAKNGLVKSNKILKDIDDQIFKLSKQINKVKRENEIEEIVLLTRNNKSFSNPKEVK